MVNLSEIMDRFKPPQFFTVLTVDALYFVAAREALERAKKFPKRIERAEAKAAKMQAEIDALSQNEDGERDSNVAFKNYNRLEQLSIWMDGAEHQVGQAYGPMLQETAAVHLFSAASLEAHINIHAENQLNGLWRDSFSWLSLQAKWLFFPKLIGTKGFDPGAEPFQGFDKLIHRRNQLAHYRVMREPWTPGGAPGFLEKLGLNIDAAEQSLNTVRGMVSELSGQLKEERPPHWLSAEKMSFFQIEPEKD